jgi:hypothetical protein
MAGDPDNPLMAGRERPGRQPARREPPARCRTTDRPPTRPGPDLRPARRRAHRLRRHHAARHRDRARPADPGTRTGHGQRCRQEGLRPATGSDRRRPGRRCGADPRGARRPGAPDSAPGHRGGPGGPGPRRHPQPDPHPASLPCPTDRRGHPVALGTPGAALSARGSHRREHSARPGDRCAPDRRPRGADLRLRAERPLVAAGPSSPRRSISPRCSPRSMRPTGFA